LRIRDIYKFAIEKGIEKDPREKKEIEEYLEKMRRDYDKLSNKEKLCYDEDKLRNPYSDTRILNGDVEKEVKKILVGVDIEVGEILLADRLNNSENKIDLVISHHPEGKAMVNLYEVMGMQADILLKYGVPINIAEDILNERIREIERRLMPINHSRAVDAARILNIPFMCIHTPCDNFVTDYLQNLFNNKSPKYLYEILDILYDIPEYRNMSTAGPKILIGSKDKRAGKVFVDMTGGTEGSKKAMEELAKAGVGTIVGMHITEEHFKEAEKYHINVIIAGHINSDTLGMNLLLDELFKIEKMEVVVCSGFRRVNRNN
jgi:putative NIF3 family GTP cyclohydrolase 1 type 2